ncbi:MAG: hypothetical protein WD448_11120 [Woeseia sp.]
MDRGLFQRASRNPEINLLLFAFLLNFVWEMWQVPFYRGMASTDHIKAIRLCTQASIGDSFITVAAFWGAALTARSRGWLHRVEPAPLLVYLTIGILISTGLEWLAIGPLERWSYAPTMPQLPLLGTGVLPLLQWIVLPPLILFFVRRQITS